MHVMVQCDVGSCAYAGMGYANPHAVTSVGGTTYTYDNNGNVTAIGSLDYTWDWRNRLSSAERGGGGTTLYGYDHTGQRVFKATGSATTSYPSRYYNVASSSLTATTTKHIFSPDGTLLATIVGSGPSTASTTYLHPDHLGGTNVATNEDGEVVQTLDYYPYGSQRIATGSFSEQRRFIGEEYDGDTEFSYLNARYYEGSRGQFLSQDPLFLALGDPGRVKGMTQSKLMEVLADPQILNSYSYARNNPLTLKDPGGEVAQALALPLIIPGVIPAILIGGAAIGSYYALQAALSRNGGLRWEPFDKTRLVEVSGPSDPLDLRPPNINPKAPDWMVKIIGAGIAAELINQIVEPFDRLEDFIRKYKEALQSNPNVQNPTPTGYSSGGQSRGGGGIAVGGVASGGGSSAGSGVDVWAVARAAISQYYAEGGK